MNSICHLIGERPFEPRDKAANVWPPAIGQLDISARIIWAFEKTRLASHVRWPRPDRLARKLMSTPTPSSGPTVGPAPSNRK